MFRLANPLWGFALLVKVMTAKRPGLEVVTNFSFLGDKMDGTAHRGKKFQKNSSFNTMTQVILQIHSAVLTSFWGRGGEQTHLGQPIAKGGATTGTARSEVGVTTGTAHC